MDRRAFALAAVGLASAAPPAEAYPVNGYAVGDHAACGAADLPAATEELARFLAALPPEAKRNAVYTDAAVRADAWATAGHPRTGVAPLVAYLATHGATVGGRFVALAGGDGGCELSGEDAGGGARYLVLSASESLKAGAGDNPDAAGVASGVTWRGTAGALNCVYGYASPMVDDSAYGEYFLDNLATTDEPLADAFGRAARRVSYANVPAVLCFGPDAAAARQHLAHARRFTDRPYGAGASAYRYEAPRKLDGAFLPPAPRRDRPLARTLTTRIRPLRHAALARALLGGEPRDGGAGAGLHVYRARAGIVTYDERTGALSWQTPPGSAVATGLKDQAALRLAREFLVAKGLIRDGELRPSYLVDRGGPAATGKVVIFHQRLGGLTTLGSAGSVEVTLDAAGEVTGITAALLDPLPARLTEWVDAAALDVALAKAKALRRLSRRLPGANLTLLDVRVGYDAGDLAELQRRPRLVAEVLIAAEQGGYVRRHLVRSPL